ncbi:ABC-type multidrug transport system, permease component [Salinispira pacifica]|uniref:ABC-type multidrug transport system, permease component n=2 Tax=Salinispira pacifica TaxID=1307761 RepID=V5WJS6_9SPIO|nr:ABC-type multidrug transport system, permease component [Salinispira pacifica]
MVKARTMEFVRDRGTFFWNLLFPFLLVFGFSFAFSGNPEGIFTVGTLGQPPENYTFLETEGIDRIDYDERDERLDSAVERLRRHQIDMLLDFDNQTYYVNREAQGSQLLLELFSGFQSSSPHPPLNSATVSGEPIRYVDWLVPGVIGMNMMFSCLFGVGFVLVRYRKNGVLKRMKATPVSALNFVSAQAASRLMIVIITSIAVFAGTNIFLNFMMNGSYFNLLLITTLAILCMIALGLVFASRIKSEELAGGLLNLVTFPMLILSGVFFSLENAPAFVGTVAKVFPLTHFIDGARAIMLDGAGLLEILPNILYLGGLTLVFLVLASFLFKWE